jgi:hypothetical protein
MVTISIAAEAYEAINEAWPHASFISTKPLSTEAKPHLRRQVVL